MLELLLGEASIGIPPYFTAPLIPTAPIWEGRAQDWPHSIEEGPGLPTEKSAACSLSRAEETEPHP